MAVGCEGGAVFGSPVIRSCLLLRLGPWAVNSTSASALPHHRWDRMAWVGGGGVLKLAISLPQVTKFVYVAFLAVNCLNGDNSPFFPPGVGRMPPRGRFISRFRWTEEGQSVSGFFLIPFKKLSFFPQLISFFFLKQL